VRDMQTEDLRFTSNLLRRPAPHGLAVETRLHHMVSVTYAVDPDTLRGHLHRRFEPDCVSLDRGGLTALVSVVTFLDRDFRFVACPWPKSTFGQTNYRAYVTDSETGEHVAWFFGTCLDSISVAVPRYVWRLPWHRGRLDFRCPYDERSARYASFAVTTRCKWAPADLEVADSGQPPRRLEGFTQLESGLVVLTHPLRGYFFRRDGTLGTYTVWHDRLQTTEGSIVKARYPLLQRLGLVQEGDTHSVHSVLLQRSVDFTIYLPPTKLRD
jgi:uncharacterized protein YqjF (DUF2071 family)